MFTPRIIGIGGLLRSGKDTVSDYLVETYGWVKMGMSEPLNDALLALDPIIPLEGGQGTLQYMRYSELHDQVGYTKAKEYAEVRRLLQVLGTEVGRKMIDEDVWVDIARRRVKHAQSYGHSVILTGVRFTNELDMIQNEGGETWWVDRPGIKAPENTGQHSSENSLSAEDFDTVIHNNGSLDQLNDKVDAQL